MKKHQFTYSETYAVWHCHGHRCWFCRQPLRFIDATVDHVLPESLLENDALRAKVLGEYALTDEFNINSFENWLPCHERCNKKKGARPPAFVPGNVLVLELLAKRAPKAAMIAQAVPSNVNIDKVYAKLSTAVERDLVTTEDLRRLFERLLEEPAPAPFPKDVLLLESGYWVYRSEVAREGFCLCERDSCVGHSGKVYCYFLPDLSPWVVQAGLYSKCYDEMVRCPRCSAPHKRGHIGKLGVCGRPFADQKARAD